MSDNFSVTESVITVEHLLKKVPNAANNERGYSLNVKDNATFDSAPCQLESTTSLPSYYIEMKQFKSSDATSIESNEDNDEYCASTQIINSCINTDSNHLEIIPVTSQLPHAYLVNDAGYIPDPNNTSNNDTDYIPDEEYDHDQSFNNILQIDIEDFFDIGNSPQTDSKEFTEDEGPKVSTFAIKDDSYIQVDGISISSATAESSF